MRKSLIFGFNVALFASMLLSQMTFAQEIEKVKKVPVAVESVNSGTIRQLLQFTGETSPLIEAYATADVNGPVSEVLVEIGQKVKKGQVLCKIDSARFEIAMRQAQANLEKAKQQFIEDEKDYKRNETLFKSKAITQKSLDSALTSYISSKASKDSAQATYDEAKLNLDRCIIRSPIDGYFVDRSVEIGQTMSKGERVGRILNMDYVYVDARISDADINKVVTGQRCLIDNQHEGTVEFMTLQADASRAFKVRIKVPNNPMKYRANAYVKGSITINTFNNVPMFPSAAIRNDKGINFVYKIKDNSAIKQVIKLIAQEGDMSYAENVFVSDVLVTQGQDNLTDGDLVTISK